MRVRLCLIDKMESRLSSMYKMPKETYNEIRMSLRGRYSCMLYLMGKPFA